MSWLYFEKESETVNKILLIEGVYRVWREILMAKGVVADAHWRSAIKGA